MKYPLAYLVTPHGELIPCRVLSWYRDDGYGAVVCEVQYTAHRPGYPRGNHDTFYGWHVLPRANVRALRGSRGRYNYIIPYAWPLLWPEGECQS